MTRITRKQVVRGVKKKSCKGQLHVQKRTRQVESMKELIFASELRRRTSSLSTSCKIYLHAVTNANTKKADRPSFHITRPGLRFAISTKDVDEISGPEKVCVAVTIPPPLLTWSRVPAHWCSFEDIKPVIAEVDRTETSIIKRSLVQKPFVPAKRAIERFLLWNKAGKRIFSEASMAYYVIFPDPQNPDVDIVWPVYLRHFFQRACLKDQNKYVDIYMRRPVCQTNFFRLAFESCALHRMLQMNDETFAPELTVRAAPEAANEKPNTVYSLTQSSPVLFQLPTRLETPRNLFNRVSASCIRLLTTTVDNTPPRITDHTLFAPLSSSISTATIPSASISSSLFSSSSSLFVSGSDLRSRLCGIGITEWKGPNSEPEPNPNPNPKSEYTQRIVIPSAREVLFLQTTTALSTNHQGFGNADRVYVAENSGVRATRPHSQSKVILMLP